MSDELWEHPEAQEWVEHVRRTLVPMLDSSAVSAIMAPPPESHDIKFAVELGMSILMDKPLLLVVPKDRTVPAKLRMVADDIYYIDFGDPASQAGLQEFIGQFVQRFVGDD